MVKRIVLFALTNVLVMVTLTTLISIFGLWPTINATGLNYGSLALFCLIWGMGGSFISLLMSRRSAKWMMGVEVIDPSSSGELGQLARTVHELSRKAGLRKMPEVGVYESPEVNAFATGPSESSALVAVSTGLLRSMDRTEIEGVLGHEIAHIKNGDMVTLTLLQGVVNAFTMFLARVIAFAIASQSRDGARSSGSMGMITILLDMVLGFLGYMVVCWFSRYREFKADRGSATILGSERPMIAALEALKARYQPVAEEASDRLAAFKIAGGDRGWMRLFMTHPPLEERIARLVGTSSAGVAAYNR